MSWAEVFLVFGVSHLVGDFLAQTEWQATHKAGGLGPDRRSRAALAAHVGTYLACFIPALIWIFNDLGLGVAIGTAALIALPHAAQDDGRLLAAYVRDVKHVGEAAWDAVYLCADQSLHFVALFLAALVIGQ